MNVRGFIYMSYKAMTVIAKQAILLCDAQKQWYMTPRYNEILSEFKQIAMKNNVTETEYQNWIKEAKRLWGSEWLKEVYTKGYNIEQVETNIVNAVNYASITATIEQFVEAFKKAQNGKIAKEIAENKFLYTFELTLIALNTMYNLGLVSQKEIFTYLDNYIAVKPSLKKYLENNAEELLRYVPTFLQCEISDGCHSSRYSLSNIFLWKPKV